MADQVSYLGQDAIIPPTLNLKLFNVQGDQFDASLYDRLFLLNAGGAVERDFFAIGLGNADPVSGILKTLADTNVRQGQIQEGTAFAGFNLKIWMEPDSNKSEAQYLDFILWARQTVISIDLPTKKDYGTWKLTEILGIPNLMLIAPAAAGSNVALVSTGTYKSLKEWNLYIPLPRLTDFRVNMLQFLAPAASLDGDAICASIIGVKNSA